MVSLTTTRADPKARRCRSAVCERHYLTLVPSRAADPPEITSDGEFVARHLCVVEDGDIRNAQRLDRGEDRVSGLVSVVNLDCVRLAISYAVWYKV